MAKNTYREPEKSTKTEKKEKPTSEKKKFSGEFFLDLAFLKDRRFQLNVGLFLIFASLYLMVSFISFIFTGRADQSVVEYILETHLRDSGAEIRNWLGLVGGISSHLFMYRWFGIVSFFFPPLLFILGFRVLFKRKLVRLDRISRILVFFSIWFSTLMGYLLHTSSAPVGLGFLSGGIGYEIAKLIYELLGSGILLLLLFSFLAFVIYFFNVTSFGVFNTSKLVENELLNNETPLKSATNSKTEVFSEADLDDEFNEEENDVDDDGFQLEVIRNEAPVSETQTQKNTGKLTVDTRLEMEVEIPQEIETLAHPLPTQNTVESEIVVAETKPEKTFQQLENYDPTADLSRYNYPSLELLKEREIERYNVTKEELEANKDKIIETLSHFQIGISKIKATVGPTVTLYEIVPAQGIRISKIKNLEDDIALSLAAIGIRIIAPIPGEGTIGIEVPNKNRQTVALKPLVGGEKFAKSKADLPIILGRTISNEVFMADLAKLPHLLIAGATGQGKSVGLNVILSSLLYKKHPSQMKMVIIDPKQVEFSIYKPIENHFLAKMPNTPESIITDMRHAVSTLNSVVVEMETRYGSMKEAECRDLKEYNQKFIERKLNPELGHKFLPYIIVVIDELADLMVTNGKEVEQPLVRLAQKGRSAGIHLIVATQRPSVNVITGLIKANFPARLSFRVTSKIDSRTILDTGGADRLIGMGDMLFSTGTDIVRLQCPFIDTEEVQSLVGYIGHQQAYPHPYELPEFIGEDGGEALDIDLSKRDSMFDEAARIIVTHQQGSTSIIQRKLSLGYNRAGRIMDQLEAAGVVGGFNGAKARDVLVTDMEELEQLLESLSR